MSIKPRRLRFRLPADLPKHWNAKSPVKTHLFNAITILAPAFERLAISSLMPYKNRAMPEALREQVMGFIGQESAHGSEFIRFNHVLKNQGYDPKKREKANVRYFKAMAHLFSPSMHLSFTLAAEHLTAIISDQLLRDKFWLKDAHPLAAALWRWHAIEEIEHKAVAYDIYQLFHRRYWQRVIGMCLVTGMLFWLLTGNYLHLLHRDGKLFKWRTWWQTFHLTLGKKGFFRKLFWPYLRYFHPRFHPWRHNNQALIADWLHKFQTLNQSEQITDYLKNH